MQNDNILHSTLIAPFIQEYPSPLQTIIKPLHPRNAPLSSLYRWRSTEPRRVNLPRSQELVTELRRNPLHQQLGQRPQSALPGMPDLEIQGKPPPHPFSWWLLLTLPHDSITVLAYEGGFESKLPQSQMETIERAGESAHSPLHIRHLQLLRKSRAIKQRQWAKQGTAVVLSLFTRHSSFALLSDSKKFQSKETKEYGWGGRGMRESDCK